MIRKPQQQRSIEKRKKILEAGYRLICQKGFQKTNTAEIAKEAGVSSGIVYRYFKDKKDIFLQAIEIHFEPTFIKLFHYLEKVETKEEMLSYIPEIIYQLIDLHAFNAQVYNELTIAILMDEDFKQLHVRYEEEVSEKLEVKMLALGFSEKNLKERICLVYNLINHLCDDSIIVDHKKIDYTVIVEKTIKIVQDILQEDD